MSPPGSRKPPEGTEGYVSDHGCAHRNGWGGGFTPAEWIAKGKAIFESGKYAPRSPGGAP